MSTIRAELERVAQALRLTPEERLEALRREAATREAAIREMLNRQSPDD